MLYIIYILVKTVTIGRFYTRDALCVWTNLGSICCSSGYASTGTRRIMRLDELCSILRLKRRTTDR